MKSIHHALLIGAFAFVAIAVVAWLHLRQTTQIVSAVDDDDMVTGGVNNLRPTFKELLDIDPIAPMKLIQQPPLKIAHVAQDTTTNAHWEFTVDGSVTNPKLETGVDPGVVYACVFKNVGENSPILFFSIIDPIVENIANKATKIKTSQSGNFTEVQLAFNFPLSEAEKTECGLAFNEHGYSQLFCVKLIGI